MFKYFFFILFPPTFQFQIQVDLQMDVQTPNVSSTQTKTKSRCQELYPGVCNLCFSSKLSGHLTQNCPFSTTLYHATNRKNLQSILQDGLHPKQGRLGRAVYTSDQPLLCVKFVHQNNQKFDDPILLKIKAFITEVQQISSPQQLTDQKVQKFKRQRTEVLKCPYYKFGEKKLYQWALFKSEYVVIASAPIRFPKKNKKDQQEKGIRKNESQNKATKINDKRKKITKQNKQKNKNRKQSKKLNQLKKQRLNQKTQNQLNQTKMAEQIAIDN